MAKKSRSLLPGGGKVKAVSTKAPKGLHDYKVQFGTRRDRSDVRTYPTAPKAKQAIVKELESWKPWCERFNKAGLLTIGEALENTDALIFHRAIGRFECCLDEHTQMFLVVDYWYDPVTPTNKDG